MWIAAGSSPICPASAALLAGLALVPHRTPRGGSWANPEDVRSLRVADFACGTGTLLSTAYQRIGQLHELAGGDSEGLHPDMMATRMKLARFALEHSRRLARTRLAVDGALATNPHGAAQEQYMA
jgi:hypothetical protein